MKSMHDIETAKRVLAVNMGMPKLSREQKAMLIGMYAALSWVEEKGYGQTLQALIDGTPVAPKSSQEHDFVFDFLNEILGEDSAN